MCTEFGIHKKVISNAVKKLHSRYIHTVWQADKHETGYFIIISLPEQLPGRSMHRTGKTHNLDTNNCINLALLQIISMPIGTGLPSPDMLLFSTPIRSLSL